MRSSRAPWARLPKVFMGVGKTKAPVAHDKQGTRCRVASVPRGHGPWDTPSVGSFTPRPVVRDQGIGVTVTKAMSGFEFGHLLHVLEC